MPPVPIFDPPEKEDHKREVEEARAAGRAVGTFAAFLLLILGIPWVLWECWHRVLTPVFGYPPITFWQSWLLCIALQGFLAGTLSIVRSYYPLATKE